MTVYESDVAWREKGPGVGSRAFWKRQRLSGLDVPTESEGIAISSATRAKDTAERRRTQVALLSDGGKPCFSVFMYVSTFGVVSVLWSTFAPTLGVGRTSSHSRSKDRRQSLFGD